jgi:hypothetical protein
VRSLKEPLTRLSEPNELVGLAIPGNKALLEGVRIRHFFWMVMVENEPK